jgi:hypothetical protein
MQRNIVVPRHSPLRGGLGIRGALPQNHPLIISSNGVRYPSFSLPGSASGDATIGKQSGGLNFANNQRDNVGQVVHASWGVQTTYNSTSWTTTGLSLTITPRFATSSILLILNMNGLFKSAVNTYGNFRIARGGGSTIVAANIGNPFLYTNAADTMASGTCGAVVTDAPATTSAITYQVQVALVVASTSIAVNFVSGVNQPFSSLVAMELLA